MRALSIAAALLAVSVAPSYSATLYSASYTGAELTSAAEVEFFVDTAVVGDAVTFSQDDSGQAMFQVQVLPAGVGGDIWATIEIDFSLLAGASVNGPQDSDPLMGIHDGDDFVGYEVRDDNSGTIFFAYGDYANGDISGAGGGGLIQKSSGYGSPGSLIFSYFIGLGDTTTSLLGTLGGQDLSVESTSIKSLNSGSALFFTMFGNNVGESYQVSRLSLSLSSTPPAPIPLPASAPLLLVGLSALASVALRRRRLT